MPSEQSRGGAGGWPSRDRRRPTHADGPQGDGGGGGGCYRSPRAARLQNSTGLTVSLPASPLRAGRLSMHTPTHTHARAYIMYMCVLIRAQCTYMQTCVHRYAQNKRIHVHAHTCVCTHAHGSLHRHRATRHTAFCPERRTPGVPAISSRKWGRTDGCSVPMEQSPMSADTGRSWNKANTPPPQARQK